MKYLLFTVSLVFAVFVSQAQNIAMGDNSVGEKIHTSEEDPMESKVPVGKHEIPEVVMNAFQSSLFQHMEVVQVFLLQDKALSDIMTDLAENTSEDLYEFKLRAGGKIVTQYFTADGELYDRDHSA